MSAAPGAPAAERPSRLVSLDAFRGFVMLLMMAEVLRLPAVARALPGSGFWAFLGYHQSHVEWVGCSLHDLIQPSFSFIVGVALPFSLAARRARGESDGRLILHAFWRALLLILLGIFLRSAGHAQTYFTFEDTLSQIGLGYGFLFLLAFRPMRDRWLAFGLLLLGIWLAFALYPLPGPGFDYAPVGVPPDWLSAHGLSGFAAHWNKNSNLAWAFDRWFLNLFPREKPFEFHPGGYSTLSFLPTLATMILGLIAGETLRSAAPPSRKLRWLALAGLVALGAGWLADAAGLCPVVKRIWTPGWVLFSGGWCLLLLAAFHLVIDHWNQRAWAFPLVVIGLNSIAAYLMAHLFPQYIRDSFRTHLGVGTFHLLGPPFEPLLLGGATLVVLWLILLWMHSRRLFLRI